MGKGKKMAGGSFMSKHARNLLNYMPIDDRAGSGSDSDLNYNGSPLHNNPPGTDAKSGHGFEGAPEKKQEEYKDMNVFKQLKHKYWDKADYSKGVTQRDINREIKKG